MIEKSTDSSSSKILRLVETLIGNQRAMQQTQVDPGNRARG
jgi:hypothetical protein